MSEHIVQVRGIKVYAYHGCMEEESVIGGRYEVDVDVYSDLSEAMQTDQIADTVDYVSVTKAVTNQMQKRSKLLEHVANRIISEIKKLDKVQKVRIIIKKLAPPVDAEVDFVAVTVEE